MAIKHILATLLAVPAMALASFPDKPITFVHGFGAGGNADTVSRIVAEGLGKELGQPVVVAARTGAGGNIASAHVANLPADGYTLILMTGGHAVSAAMYKTSPSTRSKASTGYRSSPSFLRPRGQGRQSLQVPR